MIKESTALLAMVSTPALGATLGAVETWDSDLADWQQGTTASVAVHAANGGNPDGHLQVRRDLGEAFFDVGAQTDSSADFIGDYAAANIGQISVDLNFMTSNITDAQLRFRRNAVENGWRISLTDQFLPDNTWNTYSVLFDPTWTDQQATDAGWIKDDPTVPSFADVFADVGRTEVRLSSTNESTLFGIDNFALNVPEPSSLGIASILLGFATLRRRR